MRSPLLPLHVKKSQLQVEFRKYTSHPSSGVLLERRAVQDGRCSAELPARHFPTALARQHFLPIQRHFVKHSAIGLLALEACAQHAVFLPQVKTPPGLAQSDGSAVLDATLLSKFGLLVAQWPDMSALLELGFGVNADDVGWPLPPSTAAYELRLEQYCSQQLEP